MYSDKIIIFTKYIGRRDKTLLKLSLVQFVASIDEQCFYLSKLSTLQIWLFDKPLPC